MLESLYQLAAMMVIAFATCVISGQPITVEWLLAIPILAMLTVFNVGVALIVARLTVHFRDLPQFIPFVTRLLMYTTGVFYSVELIVAGSPHADLIINIVRLNPMHDYISLMRVALMDDPTLPYTPEYWIVGGAWAVAAFVFGILFFWSAEERYGRE